MIVGILLFQAVAFAVLSGIVASNKNRDAFGWAVLGFFFGLFGFIAAVAVSEVEHNEQSTSRRKGNQSSTTREFDPDEHKKKCPMCAEFIKLEARVCRYCGHEFTDEEVEQQIQQKRDEVEDGKEQEKENKLGEDYILSSHNFGDNDVCEDCGETKTYVEASGVQCPGA